MVSTGVFLTDVQKFSAVQRAQHTKIICSDSREDLRSKGLTHRRRHQSMCQAIAARGYLHEDVAEFEWVEVGLQAEARILRDLLSIRWLRNLECRNAKQPSFAPSKHECLRALDILTENDGIYFVSSFNQHPEATLFIL